MSVFVDRHFLMQLSPKLARFTQKKDDLYNFRCPLCGDSQKNKLKCRGYVFRKKDDYFYMCHNCGASTTLYNLIKQVSPDLLEEYSVERYKNSHSNTSNTITKTIDVKFETPKFNKKLDLPSIASLDNEHFAKTYVQSRKIPIRNHSKLYYADDFKQFVDSLWLENKLLKNDKRLVIPFYDTDGNLIAFQGRALGQSTMRYITMKMTDDSLKVYGMEDIDTTKKIYVFEGPIDSMFIDNSVGTADSSLESILKVYSKEQIVLVYDNEPRNKDIVDKINHSIDNHFSVVIWPEMIKEKDINDMILSGFTSSELSDILESRTFVNLRAKMELVTWKKI